MDQHAHGVRHFFRERLWHLEPDSYQGLKRLGVKYLQVFALVVKDFWDDQCLLWASALAFTSILSLVPFCALAFAVLKGLGVQNRLEPFLLEQVTAGSQEVVSRIISYINNTNMTSLGTLGLLSLLVTVVTLLGNIEEAFNVIWGVKETRSLKRKFSDYLSVIVSGPLLLFTAISITTSLQSQEMVRWLLGTTYLGDLVFVLLRLAPYVSIWVALVFLYIFIPNTVVRFRSALLGGILAGTCWQFAQWLYIHLQVGVARYNAIYGTLSVLPVLLVWIYTSWLIVLFGVEVVYAHQNIRTFRREVRAPALNHRLRELLTLAVMETVATAFIANHPCWSAERLAEELDVPVRVVRELLGELQLAGFLVATHDEPSCYQPAREPEQITVAEILALVARMGGRWTISHMNDTEQHLAELLRHLEISQQQSLAGLTLKELALRSPAQPGQSPA
ncbi:MAG TPA: YhjD/YihY/BrkB family envelope integrity protein [Geobacteraceae bacterium]